MLKLPMVVTESCGGPYADEAFRAGYSIAMIHMGLMEAGTDNVPFVVPAYTDSVPQLDLIAMAYGWCTKIISSDEKWSCVLLTKVSSVGIEEG